MSENKDIFITDIHIKKIVDVENFTIPLNKEKRQHLIITGKNGSGKTTFLRELNKFLTEVFRGEYVRLETHKNSLSALSQTLANHPKGTPSLTVAQLKQSILQAQNHVERFGQIEPSFSKPDDIVEQVSSGNFLIVYFEAKRELELHQPLGPKAIQFKPSYDSNPTLAKLFIQHMMNQRFVRALASEDGDLNDAHSIDHWFAHVESIFVQIFEADSVNLILNRQSLSYSIQQNDQEPYPFTAQNLADGHASALIIIFELIMRMFAHGRRNNNMQGIVLIDEIDIHLHADLQKIILDSLTTLFPNIQFIVSTHSPFVLSSIENTVICDLESKIVTEAPEYGSIEFKVKYQELKHKARQNSQG